MFIVYLWLKVIYLEFVKNLFLVLLEIKFSIYHSNRLVNAIKNYLLQDFEYSKLPRTYSAFSGSTFPSDSWAALISAT